MVATPVVIFYTAKRPAPTPPAPAALVQLGSNSIAAGATLYDPASRELGGTVLEVDNAYEFADGTIPPAVTWVPQENMRRCWCLLFDLD